jgi:hypothetical protein
MTVRHQNPNNRSSRPRRDLRGSWFSWPVIALAILLTHSTGIKHGLVIASVMSTVGTIMAYGPGRHAASHAALIVYFDEDEDSMRLPAFHRLGTNLMLPPGNHSQLCEYPTGSVEEYLTSLRSQSGFTSESSSSSNNNNNNKTNETDSDFLPVVFEHSPLTLLVSLGGCDVMQKVRVALQIQQHVTADLWSIVFYNSNDTVGNADEIAPIEIPRDTNSTTVPGIDGLILAAISYSSSVMILDQMDRIVSFAAHVGDVVSPVMLTGKGNDVWRFPLSLEPGSSPYTNSDSDDSSGGVGSMLFTWIRLILIGLFILLPFTRCVVTWHRAGGRILLDRDQNGRIVGLRYQRATVPIRDDGDSAGQLSHSRVHGRLTKEQVMELLPEVPYVAPPYDDDIVLDGEEYTGSHPTPATSSSRKDKPVIQIGMGSDDTVPESSVAGRCQDTSTVETMTDTSTGTPAVSQEEGGVMNTTGNTAQRIGVNDSSNDLDGATDIHTMGAGAKDGRPCVAITKPLFTTTTSTTCSICIEEFVEGEAIRLLPRCGHAYHTECILPWLTERQGCCPFCKTEAVGSSHKNATNDD